MSRISILLSARERRVLNGNGRTVSRDSTRPDVRFCLTSDAHSNCESKMTRVRFARVRMRTRQASVFDDRVQPRADAKELPYLTSRAVTDAGLACSAETRITPTPFSIAMVVPN